MSRNYDDFTRLVEEAEQAQNEVTVLFEKAYYSRKDTTRLQRVFDKMTGRLIRRMGHVHLLDFARNYSKEKAE